MILLWLLGEFAAIKEGDILQPTTFWVVTMTENWCVEQAWGAPPSIQGITVILLPLIKFVSLELLGFLLRVQYRKRCLCA